MIERYSIDTVADAVQQQFRPGSPLPKLLRRFFREGRRNGKRNMPSDAARELVKNAVELANSHIAGEFLDARSALNTSLTAAQARLDSLLGDLGRLVASPPTLPSEAPSESSDDTGHQADDLVPALRETIQSRHNTKVQALEQQVNGAREAVAAVTQQLVDLPIRYNERVTACQETGELIWARYRLGYLRGSGKPAMDEADGLALDAGIDFERPSVLADPADAPTDTVTEGNDHGVV